MYTYAYTICTLPVLDMSHDFQTYTGGEQHGFMWHFQVAMDVENSSAA